MRISDWSSDVCSSDLKGFQGACPMGPYLTPARYVADPQNLDLKLWVGDELMQSSNTKHMIFSIAEQIEEISARVTMQPGAVVLTGTPSGVGISRGRSEERRVGKACVSRWRSGGAP